MPNAAQYHAAALEAYNTTKLSPDEIHEMGLRLIEQLHQEMDKILNDSRTSRTGTTPRGAGRCARIPSRTSRIPTRVVRNSLEALNEQIRDLQPLLPKYFGRLAKPSLRSVAFRSTSSKARREATTSRRRSTDRGLARTTSICGIRVSCRKPACQRSTYHEGNPGHLWLGTIAQESTDLPMIRRAVLDFAGFSEGLELYRASSCARNGSIASVPRGRLGYLQSWCIAQLISSWIRHASQTLDTRASDCVHGRGHGDPESSIMPEVERYAAMPVRPPLHG